MSAAPTSSRRWSAPASSIPCSASLRDYGRRVTAFKAACIQITAGREIDPNIAAASDLVRRARDAGAELIMTPEVSDMIEPKRAARLAKARDEASHPMLAAFRDLARETGA